jgi:hypothetical protein
MEKVIFTALTKQDLETLVIDCVLVCLKNHERQAPRQTAHRPDQASPTHAEKRAISNTQKQSA